MVDGQRRSFATLGTDVVRHFRSSIALVRRRSVGALIAASWTGPCCRSLELGDRGPASYESVDRLCNLAGPVSRYIALGGRSRTSASSSLRAVSRANRCSSDGFSLCATAMKGWSRVVFRRDGDGSRHAFSAASTSFASSAAMGDRTEAKAPPRRISVHQFHPPLNRLDADEVDFRRAPRSRLSWRLG